MSFVGDILKAEREKQKLSIKDIESGTNIRSLYITAIEENKFDVKLIYLARIANTTL